MAQTRSARMALLPGIETPPVCIATRMPRACAQRTIGPASSGVQTAESPISPTSWTPASAISSKSASVNPCSRMTAPAMTFTPAGRALANALAARIASAFVPARSFGRPGTCGSPAEIIEVTPPCRQLSMKSRMRCRGEKSPITGWTWLSMRPGISVAPAASIVVSPSTAGGAPASSPT